LEYTLKKEKLKSTDYADFVWRSIIAPEQRSFRQAAVPSFIFVWVRREAEKRNLRNLCNLRILILVFEGVLNKERKT
jgi:hypothetical protein